MAARETLFDPLCVDAFLDLIAEQQLRVDRSRIEPGALAVLAHACHPARRRGLLRRRAG